MSHPPHALKPQQCHAQGMVMLPQSAVSLKNHDQQHVTPGEQVAGDEGTVCPSTLDGCLLLGSATSCITLDLSSNFCEF